MLKHGKLFFLALFLLIFCQLTGISQPTGTIRLESGGSVPFHINSLQKYNDGMVLNNWTRFSILIENLDPADDWRLEVLASDPKLIGDFGRELELDYISITAVADNPEAESLNYFPINQLSNGPQTLATGQGSGVFVIWINYGIGTDPNNILLGEHPDYYFVQIYFDIKSD
jgi:hypothetical protein